MRTIKRKRIFGGKKSIHKKKHKRSLKKFRGGVELNYLQDTEIYKVKGILGYQKPGFLYTGEEKYGKETSTVDLTQPTTPNLFKGNIKHDKGSVILTDYKPLKSIKLGWIYGGHFGNIVIYSSADKLNEVISKINKFYFLKNGGLKIINTLFIPEINERVIKFCEKEKELINEISPWGDMTHEFDLNEDDITDTEPLSLDSIFKDILKKYYLEKIDGISKDKISSLLNTVEVGEQDINTIRADNKLLEKYKDILQRRNKSFVKEKEFTSENIGGELVDEKWTKKVEQGQQYPDIYKKINALRLKQEIIYKELTDIFSTYKKDTYPFNIEYFSCNILSPKESDILIKKIIEKFNIDTPTEPKLLVKFNNRIYKSISKIMYILQIFNPTNEIYRNSGIVRYKNITDEEYNKPAKGIERFFSSGTDMNGFREFMNGYVINSIIDPVIMARLISFNIQIKATILLSCTNDDGKPTYNIGDEQFHELTKLDVNQEDGLYKKINDDESRLKIKRLKINGKEITPEDLESSKTPGNSSIQNKIDEFTKVLNEEGDIQKNIECELKNPFAKKSDDDDSIKLNCKCKIYKKEEDNITNIMIYLYDDTSSFNHDLIKNILIKANYNDTIYTDINGDHLESFYSHLFKKDDGHEHNYYDITF